MTKSDDYIDLMYGNVCTHNRKYPFIRESSLKEYMQQSRGWVEDLDGEYTANYIIVNLLANAKAKNRLILDARDKYYILCDRELQKALQTLTPVICIDELRPSVLRQLQHKESNFHWRHRYKIPLWCVKGIDTVLLRIFDNFYECRDTVMIDYCQL